VKLGHECLPCLLIQAKNMCDQTKVSEGRKTEILKRTSHFLLRHFSLDTVSADFGVEVQLFVMTELGKKDPYRLIKDASNRRAEEIFKAKGCLPFRKAIMASIAGNIIDYSLDEVCHDIEKDFFRILKEKLAVDHSRDLKREIEKSKRILFMTDNCGEIIFDKFLLQHLYHRPLFIAAKASPYANDATVSDLRRWGFSRYGKIVSTGSGNLGLKGCSKSFLQLFHSSLVIAKGMGLWEYFSEGEYPSLFHLFRIKCDRVARELSLRKGSNVCMRNC